MIENWNRVIGPNDLVIVVGDFAISTRSNLNYLKWIIPRLNGKRILVRGNHDHLTDQQYIEDMGFTKVVDYFEMGSMFFSHYPIYSEDDLDAQMKHFKKQEEIDLVIKSYTAFENSKCTKVVHGHIHTCGPEVYPNHYNVAVDRHHYLPQCINDIAMRLKHAMQ